MAMGTCIRCGRCANETTCGKCDSPMMMDEDEDGEAFPVSKGIRKIDRDNIPVDQERLREFIEKEIKPKIKDRADAKIRRN